MGESDNQPKLNRTIKVLQKKAKNGDVLANYQLYRYFQEGQFVEKNISKSKAYKRELVSSLGAARVFLKGMSLLNFRGFKKLSLEFSDHSEKELSFILFVGMNGAGKTTILDGIVNVLSWLVKGILGSGGKGLTIEENDISNNASDDYSSIVARFGFLDSFSPQIELSKALTGSNTSRRNTVNEATVLGDIYRAAIEEDKNTELPLFAYYSINRADEIGAKDLNVLQEPTESRSAQRFDAYAKCLSGSAEFKLFFVWFKFLSDINNSRQSALMLNIKNSISSEKLERLKSALQSNLADNERVINEILKGLEGEIPVDSENGAIAASMIENVKNAIYIFMPEFSNLRMQYEPKLDLLVDKNGLPLSVLQLSHGEKSLFALIADISRRLAILNPQLPNPLLGSGVILVDELDLHLHPRWQQLIIPNLKKTFPNIQFIGTTHSPFVVTTLSSDSIFQFKDFKMFHSPKGTKGAESSRVSRRVFDVELRPPNDENTEKLNRYAELVYEDNWGSVDAEQLRKQLQDTYGDEEPLLTELDIYIEGRKWEIEIEKDQ